MAEFDEKKAAEIIKRLGLSETTLRVWKNRGAIPSKYLNENYTPPTGASKAEKVLEQRITDLLRSGLVNATVVTELAGISRQKAVDVARGGSSYSHEEIIRIKSEVNKLKITIARTFERKSYIELKKLLNNPAFILKTTMLHCTALQYEHANRIKLGKIEPSELDYSIIKDAFIKTALQFTL